MANLAVRVRVRVGVRVRVRVGVGVRVGYLGTVAELVIVDIILVLPGYG